jgi:hypothetical protein
VRGPWESIVDLISEEFKFFHVPPAGGGVLDARSQAAEPEAADTGSLDSTLKIHAAPRAEACSGQFKLLPKTFSGWVRICGLTQMNTGVGHGIQRFLFTAIDISPMRSLKDGPAIAPRRVVALGSPAQATRAALV